MSHSFNPLAVLLAASFLTGCGNDGTNATGTHSGTQSESEAEAVAAIEDIVGGDVNSRERRGSSREPRKEFSPPALVVEFVDCKVRDKDLVHLRALKHLKRVKFEANDISDFGGRLVTGSGLVNLKGLSELEHVSLNGMSITGAGLVHLKGLENLRILSLMDSKCRDVAREGDSEHSDIGVGQHQCHRRRVGSSQ